MSKNKRTYSEDFLHTTSQNSSNEHFGDELEDYIWGQIKRILAHTTGHYLVRDAIKKQTGRDVNYVAFTDNINTGTHPNDRIKSTGIEESMQYQVEKRLIPAILENAPREEYHSRGSIAAPGGTIITRDDIDCKYDKYPDKDGYYHATIYFNEDNLKRQSLKASPNYAEPKRSQMIRKYYSPQRDDLKNIVHLFQTGWSARAYVYGRWGHKWTYNNGVASIAQGSSGRWYVRSRKQYTVEKGRDFLSKAIHEYNIYNSNRIGSFARLVGQYAQNAGGQDSWEDIMGVYHIPYRRYTSLDRKSKEKWNVFINMKNMRNGTITLHANDKK